MVNLSGSYKFYLDGELVLEKENLITTVGKSVIRKYLAGTYPDWAYAIGIGVGTGSTTTAASVSDVKLQYEIERQPVIYRSTYTSGSDELILLKAQFSNSLVASIKEVGVFPSVTTSLEGLYNDRVITDFSETDWSVTPTTGGIIGTSNIQLTSTVTSATLSNLSFPLDGYSPADKLSLLVTNGDVAAKTITIAMTGTNGTKSYTFSVGNTATTQIIDVLFDTGAKSLGTLTSMTVSCTQTTGQTLSLDALKIVNYDEYGPAADMVSRSVLGTTLVKTAGQELEIEYSLKVG